MSRERGATAHHAGLAAEGAVERVYADAGCLLREARWRGAGGEIDLIFAEGDGVVFVEVKQSHQHATAALSLRPDQIARLRRSAEDYLGRQPAGLLTPARFDVALVDISGRVEIIANALMG